MKQHAIWISESTKAEFNKLGDLSMTQDDVLRMLLDVFNQNKKEKERDGVAQTL